MDKSDIINKTAEFVKNRLLGEATGHDWWHVYRVWNNSKLILKNEHDADSFVVELASLLHDVSDWKFSDGDEMAGTNIARDFLSSINTDENIINHVCEIILTISFKGAGVKTPMKTLEGKIVQDADRLDALGAIGIARTFAYGAYANQEIYNPDIKPHLHNNFEEYKSQKGTSVNHFYEKLLLLVDRMNTKAAKKIALNRQKYMEDYLEQFYLEWNGVK